MQLFQTICGAEKTQLVRQIKGDGSKVSSTLCFWTYHFALKFLDLLCHNPDPLPKSVWVCTKACGNSLLSCVQLHEEVRPEEMLQLAPPWPVHLAPNNCKSKRTKSRVGFEGSAQKAAHTKKALGRHGEILGRKFKCWR